LASNVDTATVRKLAVAKPAGHSVFAGLGAGHVHLPPGYGPSCCRIIPATPDMLNVYPVAFV